MNKVVTGVIVLVVVAGVGVAIAKSNKKDNTPMPAASTNESTKTDTSTTPTATSTVDIQDFVFTPSDITVKKGTTVTWTNKDSAPHTVTGDSGGPASGTLAQNATYSLKFDTVGTFAYHCTFHSNMVGTVKVTE